MTIARVTQQSGEILAALARVIVGKADVLERILAGILANGHVLIEDYPGLAKTLIARLCLLYTSPSPRDRQKSRMPSSA